ncbi:hypothetical protein ACS0TY_011701 [Phlomoides rotata]
MIPLLTSILYLFWFAFEDFFWDEFCQSDDHIVPHPGIQQAKNYFCLDDSTRNLAVKWNQDLLQRRGSISQW